MNSFLTRLVSAFILFPPVIYLVYLGGYFYAALLIVTFVISLGEWARLCAQTNLKYVLMGSGFLYLVTAFTLFYILRGVPEVGLYLTMLAFFCVWSSDSWAYIFGKLMGGKKLAPMISPNKTYAGLVGAIFGPVFILVIVKYAFPSFEDNYLDLNYAFIIIFSTILGLLSQAGDLLVSLLKRIAGVKDTGNLIPGHGGLLDRIDSLLLGAPFFTLTYIYYLS